jgi:hypothetical protein
MRFLPLLLLAACTPVQTPQPQTIVPMCDAPRGALVYVVRDGEQGRVTALSAMPSDCKPEAGK